MRPWCRPLVTSCVPRSAIWKPTPTRRCRQREPDGSGLPAVSACRRVRDAGAAPSHRRRWSERLCGSVVAAHRPPATTASTLPDSVRSLVDSLSVDLSRKSLCLRAEAAAFASAYRWPEVGVRNQLVRTSRVRSARSESGSQAPPDGVGLVPSAVTPTRNLLDRTTILPNVINLDASIDPTAQLFGERLKQLRSSRRMTQAQISEATGITPAYVSLVERGRANPTLDMMVKLADAVGSKVWDMIKPEGDVSS